MSNRPKGGIADRDAKPDNVPEPSWIGWVVIPDRDGWRMCRVNLPQSVVDAHIVGPPTPPDVRAMLVGRIENDLVSDRLVDRRGWERSQ